MKSVLIIAFIFPRINSQTVVYIFNTKYCIIWCQQSWGVKRHTERCTSLLPWSHSIRWCLTEGFSNGDQCRYGPMWLGKHLMLFTVAACLQLCDLCCCRHCVQCLSTRSVTTTMSRCRSLQPCRAHRVANACMLISVKDRFSSVNWLVHTSSHSSYFHASSPTNRCSSPV